MKFIILLLTCALCSADDFSSYWYSGKAEVAVYDLEQWGYGELRKGTATLIFVTEPFSQKKQVKLDSPSQASDDKITVMKMNKVKKYLTGIYPYSLMVSAFSDVNTGSLVKANTSLQEWCGHTFLQANANKRKEYGISQYSYFESQGDLEKSISGAILEEELWLNLRLGKEIKKGKGISLVPSQEYTRLLLCPYEATKADVSLLEEESHKKLRVTYDHPYRLQTEVTIDSAFPHTIKSWSETYTRGGKEFTNSATLISVQQLPYWEMNAKQFEGTRQEIGLDKK